MIFRFGPYSLDREQYELQQDGELLRREPQVLEVLVYLIEHRDRVVSRDELVETIWEGRFVSDSAVSRTIKEVRRLLGDSASESRWVKTVYGRGFRFVGEAESVDEASTRTPAENRIAPFPVALNPLIGRERELDETAGLLRTTRLLTLSGAAGTGKSRLALALAERVRSRFPGGCAFVSLAEIRDAELVPGAIAHALGITDAAGGSALESVQIHLSDANILLVLDNFEQVVEAAPRLSELLQACPRVVMLVTSRFVLGVEGEQEYPVPPLALPARDTDAAALAHVPTVELFLARACAVQPGFEPDSEELAYVAEICRRLDGLPLAIELAAARIKMFPPRALWERLTARMDLLSSPSRHQGHAYRTLEQALSWSDELLEEDERSFFHRLSVFSAGFTIDAVEQVLGEDEALVERIAGLVDKSLLERHGAVAGEPRFRMLETTREFALAKLPNEISISLREAHAQWILDLARRGERALAGGDQKTWLERLDADYGNALAAIEWARRGGDLETGLATGAALVRYWSARGTYREGRAELQSLIDQERIDDVDTAVRVDALTALGLLTLLLCDYRRAREILEEARTLASRLEDRARLAQILDHLAWVAAQVAPLDEAEALAREALTMNEELGRKRGVAVALNNLAWIALYRGERARAESHLLVSLHARREIADDRGVAFTLANLAMVRLTEPAGLSEVRDWLEEARRLVDRLADHPLQSWVDCMECRLMTAKGTPQDALFQLDARLMRERDRIPRDALLWALLIRGEGLAATGDGASAGECFDEALSLARSLGVPWDIARTLMHLADVHGDRELYRQALDISERFGLDGCAKQCRAALGA